MQIDKIVDDLLNRFNQLVVKKTWGETSLFFNPKGASAHGSYFLTIKESDGENDQASNLDRDDVFRVSFGVSRNSYEALFGPKPPRPARGGVVKTGHDFTQTNLLMPHPIYAWMHWVQVLNPSQETWNSNQNLIQESYELSKARFEKK
ncbi:MAG: DUF6194 family protein [Actinomycetota bacterium]